MAACPEPVAVTLASGNHADLRWFKDEVDIHEWLFIELGEFYGDMTSPVDPMLAYTNELVIKTVVGLPGFADAVFHIIDGVASRFDLVSSVNIFISGDLHIASVTSACAASQLNSLVHRFVGPGYVPLRAWNCNWFSFNKCSATGTWLRQVDNIEQWANHCRGWDLIVGPTTEMEMFGYDAATKSSSSSKNWKTLCLAIEDAKDEFGRFCHLRTWHEFPEPPRREESTSHDRPREIDGAAETPDWVTFNKDPMVWRSYLEKTGVDEAAQQSLFLLAQSSTENYWEANSIISKLIKKVVDRRELRNPSGFVFSSVLNVRNARKPRCGRCECLSMVCERCGPDQ